MKKIIFCTLLLFCTGFSVFSQNWFDMSMPNIDRRACLVSEDAGRIGYREAVALINTLSGNKAEDVSAYLAKEITSEQITQLALQLFQKTGKAGTYVMEADIQSGNILMRYYYIVCAGWDNTYLYAFAYVL